MNELLSRLGHGLIKFLVSCLFGGGVGLLVVGFCILGDSDNFFRRRDPPGGLFLAIGAGLMTTAGLLVFFFLSPWGSRRSPPPELPSAKDFWPEERMPPKAINKDPWPEEGAPPKPIDDSAFESRR